jgi:hypothetical protein
MDVRGGRGRERGGEEGGGREGRERRRERERNREREREVNKCRCAIHAGLGPAKTHIAYDA